ncbi:hypothetical protein HAX54_033915 [Datura stramonium]|uniref:Uncharacterized protein n=1 Tax=Datura stramonium TaxID=4076 RepID=A0ABS8SDY4_DATST|nr:hypothetical protein [Datura stramonium]
MESHITYRPSLSPSSNQVIIPPKFQPTRGGARRRVEKADTAHHLRDENTNSEGDIKEVGTAKLTPGYQTRSAARQQAEAPQSNEGNDSSVGVSSSSSEIPNSNEGSGNEATSSPTEDTETIRGDIIKCKIPGLRDSMHLKMKGVEKHFQEGLTTTSRGHLRCSIVEEVRIIDSALPDYPDIEAKYRFYGLGWMSKAPSHY